MCNPLDISDRNDQQTTGLEYGENLFSFDSDYLDVGELSTSMFPQGNLNIIQFNVRGPTQQTIKIK